jgi:hypothetical protein
LLSETITSAGACPARTKYGRYSARAVAVSPDTRLRPVPPAKCRRTRSNAAEDSRSAINSRTKGRIMLFPVYQRLVGDRLAAMRRSVFCFFALLICAALSQTVFAQLDRAGTPDATSSKCHGLTCSWAASAPLHQHIAGYEFYLDPVPGDNPSSLVIKRKENELLRTTLKDVSANITITCALGCNVFAVTWIDGDAIGNFHVRVFATFGGGFFETNTTDQAAQQFKSHHDCPSKSTNIQAYRFENSQTLLLILSVPTADCGTETGYTEGYLVRVSDGRVLRTVTNDELNAYRKHHPEGS